MVLTAASISTNCSAENLTTVFGETVSETTLSDSALEIDPAEFSEDKKTEEHSFIESDTEFAEQTDFADDEYSGNDDTEKSSLTEPVYPPSFAVAGVFGGRNVTFSSETAGAVIYYSSTSSTLTTEDLCVENGGTVLFEDFYGTIYARAYYDGNWSNVSRLILKIPMVNKPEITISGEKAVIKSSTPSSYIYYTTDGTTPTRETGRSLGLNGGTISVKAGTTLKAIAVRSCFTNSETVSVYVPVSPAAFKVEGTFGGRNVTFSSETAGAKIYYSSTTSNLNTSDTCVENGETVLFENFYGTIYARAYYDGKWSNVSRLILKIPIINTPTITFSGSTATIKTTTPNCYIYYTTDGSEPSVSNGTKLSSNSCGQVSVLKGTYVRAIAVRSCFTNSEIVMDSVYSENVLEIVNENRAENGLDALTIDSELNYVAYLKAKDFTDKGYFAHESPTYGSPSQLLDYLNIPWSYCGENIAYGQLTPSSVMTAWMNSTGHRANILCADYGKIGIGYYYYQGIPYWVQIFTE
ncbi:MAG: chitobiase/beta-hexosaminidase C-terminal domain-containing protein [Clostridiales bacterium]|nr:chitobiase/beta-hexosaminidase C-terminal domain-containing protein [Clostridiales bacterium]